MKILHISLHSYLYKYGGIEKNVTNLLDLPYQYKVDHLIISKSFSKVPFKINKSKIFVQKKKSYLNIFLSIIHFFKIYKEYDIIHFHHTRAIILLLLSFTFHKKIISTIHANVVDYFKGYKIFNIINLFILFKSKKVILTNKNILDNKIYIKFNKKISIIYHGEKKNKKIKILNKNYLLCIARGGTDYKNYKFLNNFKSLPLDLYIIGMNRTDTERLNYCKNIKYLFNIKDEIKEIIISNCTALVSFSNTPLETFNITLIEGFKYHKPAITFQGSLASNIVNENMKTGLVLNNQKKNFIKAINDLRHNKKLYNSLSNGAYKKFIEKFQLKNTNRKYIDLIKSL